MNMEAFLARPENNVTEVEDDVKMFLVKGGKYDGQYAGVHIWTKENEGELPSHLQVNRECIGIWEFCGFTPYILDYGPNPEEFSCDSNIFNKDNDWAYEFPEFKGETYNFEQRPQKYASNLNDALRMMENHVADTGGTITHPILTSRGERIFQELKKYHL